MKRKMFSIETVPLFIDYEKMSFIIIEIIFYQENLIAKSLVYNFQKISFYRYSFLGFSVLCSKVFALNIKVSKGYSFLPVFNNGVIKKR